MTSLSEEFEFLEPRNGQHGHSEDAEEFVMVNGAAHAERLRNLEQRILEQKETIEFLHAQLQEKDNVIDLLKFQLRAEREKGRNSTLAGGKGGQKAKG